MIPHGWVSLRASEQNEHLSIIIVITGLIRQAATACLPSAAALKTVVCTLFSQSEQNAE